MNEGQYLIATVTAILATGTASSLVPDLGLLPWIVLVVLGLAAGVVGSVRRELRIRRRLAAIQPRTMVREDERIEAGR